MGMARVCPVAFCKFDRVGGAPLFNSRDARVFSSRNTHHSRVYSFQSSSGCLCFGFAAVKAILELE